MPCLESSGRLTLLDQNRVIRPHPAFRLFATANTIGLGDTTGLYHGTQQINQGQMDRWNIVTTLNYLDHDVEAEIVAAQPDTSIYQDIHVTPGNTYHWSLKHQSGFARHVDRMQVLIGEPGKETPQQATRTKTNGGTDGTGDVGTDIATANITDKDSRNWETYEGNWTCPEGVTVARFTFKSIDAPSWNNGNLVDDIGFSQSTTLRYDPNGGTGMMADQTVGVGVNAYTATDGYTFAGHGLASWNTRSDGTGDSYKPGETVTSIPENTTLYPQWEARHVLRYDANGGDGEYGDSDLPADVTDTVPTREGYEFDGWTIDGVKQPKSLFKMIKNKIGRAHV